MEFLKSEDYQDDSDEEKASIWDEKQNILEVLQHYAADDTIPKELRSREWAVFGKALVNTFLKENDLPMIDIFSQILRIDSEMTKPPHLMTFKEVANLDKMDIYMFLTAKRAIGIENNKMNERTLQNTQIGQSISTHLVNPKAMKPPSTGGIFKRFARGV